MGATIVILTGGIDLSVGAVMALSMTCVAGALLAGIPQILAILMALIVGILCGAVNGVSGVLPPSASHHRDAGYDGDTSRHCSALYRGLSVGEVTSGLCFLGTRTSAGH